MASIDVPDANTLRLLALLADPEPSVRAKLYAERIFERILFPFANRTPAAFAKSANRL